MIQELELRDITFEKVDYKLFNNLQGKLKKLDKASYAKLKQSLLDYKFSFPVFAWRDKKEKIWIIDAHQRLTVIVNMADEGYVIPSLPTVFIEAKDRREAKELLLLLNSKYGEITQTGFESFINEKDYEIDLAGMEGILEIPEVDMGNGLYEDEIKEKEIEEQELLNECPKCGYRY